MYLSPFRRMTLAVILVSGIAMPAIAEKAPMTPDRKRAMATHVIVGTVQAIYTREAREGSYQVTHYVAEVAVLEVEKGDRLAVGELAYVRYWTQRWVGAGPMPPGTAGQGPIPVVGATHRVYLASRSPAGSYGADRDADGGFNAVFADGFEAATALVPAALTGASLEVAAEGEQPAFRWGFGADGSLAIESGTDAALPAALTRRLLGREIPTRSIAARWELAGHTLVLRDLHAAELQVPGPVVLGAVPLHGGGSVFLAGYAARLPRR